MPNPDNAAPVSLFYSYAHERPKAGRSRPPPAGIKESGKATFP